MGASFVCFRHGLGEFYADESAAFRAVRKLHRAAVRFYDGPNDRQAQPCPTVLGGKEGVHSLVQGFLGKAGASVAEGQPCSAGIVRAAADKNPSLSVQGLLGIGKNIIEGAVQQVAVAKHSEVFRYVDMHFRTASLEFSAQKSHCLIDDKAKRNLIPARLARAGVVEKIVDRRSKAAGLVVNSREHGLRHGVFAFMPPEQKFGAGTDDAEGIAYLVGDGSDHAAHTGELFRLMELGFKLAIAGHTAFKGVFGLAGYELEKEEQDKGGHRKTAEDEPLRTDSAPVLGSDILNDLKHAENRHSVAVEAQFLEVAVDGQRENGTQKEGAVFKRRREKGLRKGNGRNDIEMMGLALEDKGHAFGRKIRTPHFPRVHRVQDGVVRIEKSDGFKLKTVDLRFDNVIQKFVLRRVAKGNPP